MPDPISQISESLPAGAAKPGLISVSELLKKSWDLFIIRIWRFLEIILIQVGLYALLFTIAGLGYLLFKFEHSQVVLLAIYVLVGLFLAVIIYYFILRFSIALLYVAVYEEHSHLHDYFAASKGKVGQYFWLAVLEGAVIFGGTIFFIVPGIFMGVALTFSKWVYLLESRKNLDALQQSRRYAYGRWGGIFGRTLLLGLIVGVISGSLQYLVQSKQGVDSLISSVIGFIVSGYEICFGYLLYKSAAETASQDYQPKRWHLQALLAICVIAIIAIPVIAVYLAVHVTDRHSSFWLVHHLMIS